MEKISLHMIYIKLKPERKRLKEKRKNITQRDSYKILTSLFDTTTDFLYLLDERGTILKVNRAVLNRTGYTEEEILGLSIEKIFSPASQEIFAQKFPVLLKNKVNSEEVDIVCKNGEIVNVLCTGSIVCDDYGDIIYIIVYQKDITNLKRSEEKLRQMDKIKLLGQLAAGVAHEVRNPLNSILAITEALFQDIGDNPEYKIFLEHIKKQVDRLSKLMNDLLDLARPIYPSNFHKESLYTICKAAINLFKEEGVSQKHKINLFLSPEKTFPEVMADSSRLQQAFLNLLKNSCQNSPEDEEIEFILSLHDRKFVKIFIVDHGIGIPIENLQNVFDPFFTTQKGSYGLGLSLTKHIIESHGGEILIYNNNPPPGCTVEIMLPIANEEIK
ncbi:MAG: PAS domain S-box protein [Nitrospirae bacterium]|nr:PAS domain S-box protein [Nitrospirota bacterium]